MNALDFVGEHVSSTTLAQAKEYIKLNYGLDYSEQKFEMLFDMIDEDGWSEERFKRTFRWFVKNKKFPNWTVSDWYDYGVKIYPYSWYLKQVADNGACVNNQIEVYKLGENLFGYKYVDGEYLPFPHRMVGGGDWE